MKIAIRNLKPVGLILVAVLFLSQAIRIEKSNPPVQSDISADPAIRPLLRRACYNCHSNETNWPWYSNVAPFSWLIGSDVTGGRRHVNFSEWATYGSAIQSHKLAGIAEEVRDGEMPPWYYTWVHSDSRLSPAERNEIHAWAMGAAKLLTAGR